jgi:hypothetical protein
MNKKPNYVYVASSWRNGFQEFVCQTLKAAGIDHYDFKNPPEGAGFSWREVKTPDVPSRVPGSATVKTKGSDWEDVEEYLRMIDHPRAVEGFNADMAAMQRADTFILVLPCGKSAHLELGWAVGAGKRTAILLESPIEPELMYKMVDHMAISMFDMLGWLGVED